MAMAATLLATPFARATPSAALPPTKETLLWATRSAMDHGSRASILRPILSNFSSCSSSSSRGPVEPIASGLSSSGRDGGACSMSRSTANNSSRNAADFGWRISSSGLLSLDVDGLSAVPRTWNWAAVPRKRLPLRISAEKPDLTNVAGTLLRVGKQGLEAGTNLVPASVPRPVAQAGVGLAGLFLASFLLRSLFSTVLFILAIGAVSYAGYYFLTKGESSSSSSKDGDGSSSKPKSGDDALEEARRIMEKYK